MKKLKQTGTWDNEPIYREEEPEETLERHIVENLPPYLTEENPQWERESEELGL
jgi:hypothetical protein